MVTGTTNMVNSSSEDVQAKVDQTQSQKFTNLSSIFTSADQTTAIFTWFKQEESFYSPTSTLHSCSSSFAFVY
jgi:hypothetical protein